jgi:hypothetical protein
VGHRRPVRFGRALGVAQLHTHLERGRGLTGLW